MIIDDKKKKLPVLADRRGINMEISDKLSSSQETSI